MKGLDDAIGFRAGSLADAAEYAVGWRRVPREPKKRPPTPLEPEWPVEHACKHCGARVYRVDSQDGETIEIDVDELELCVDLDEQLSCGGDEPQTIVRANALLDDVREVGGYQLVGPELFRGWEDEPCEWRWYLERKTLGGAHREGTPIHSAHFTTCKARGRRAVLAKLTAPMLSGEMTGWTTERRTALKQRTRNLNLRAMHEPDDSLELEAGAASSLPNPATDPDRSQQLEFLLPHIERRHAPAREVPECPTLECAPRWISAGKFVQLEFLFGD